jgi:ABC-type phosphate transport system substrate-binding protein
MVSRRRSRLCTLVATLLVAALVALLDALPAHATSHVPLIGDGSSWAQPAIDQWSRDVSPNGITIDFSGDGSAAGRQHYIQNQADFAASDIAFLTTPDPFGAGTESSAYAYSYVPIVAGGTSFMYNLVVAGQKITNLRLSGETLAKIFTGKITDWSDPAITHDYGQQLPSQHITVVTRSDGAGASYMFTRWLWKEYPSVWTPFCKSAGGGGDCGPTEFYPPFNGSVQRNGSDQIASYIASPSFGEGSIGYDEYAYALNNNIPVVKVLNKAGYYTLPTPSNVAIALQAAVIDENPASSTFLMQNLDGVYTNSDPRTYPLSSYSYLIIPRDSRVVNQNKEGPPPRFSTAKGETLSTWLNYVLCGAQQKAGSLGYSPLPKNLVVGGFLQVDHTPGHVATPDLKQLDGCNNPTYSDGVNHLIKDAPMPSPCDKLGAPLTCTTGGGAATGPRRSHTHKHGRAAPGGVPVSNSPGTAQAGAPTGAAKSAPADSVLGGGASTAAAAGDGSGGTTQQVVLAGAPQTLEQPGQNWLLPALAALDLLAVIVVPGLVISRLRRRRGAPR